MQFSVVFFAPLEEVLRLKPFTLPVGASEGWSAPFKERHSLVSKTMCGGSTSVDAKICETWRNGKLREYLNWYAPEDYLMPTKLFDFIKCCRTGQSH